MILRIIECHIIFCHYLHYHRNDYNFNNPQNIIRMHNDFYMLLINDIIREKVSHAEYEYHSQFSLITTRNFVSNNNFITLCHDLRNWIAIFCKIHDQIVCRVFFFTCIYIWSISDYWCHFRYSILAPLTNVFFAGHWRDISCFMWMTTLPYFHENFTWWWEVLKIIVTVAGMFNTSRSWWYFTSLIAKD